MRRAASIILFAFVLAIAIASCGKQRQQSPNPPAVDQAVETGKAGPFVVIGHLEHRDRVVTISAGTDGPLYTARGKDGKLLFENLTAEQMKTQSPEIHDFIEAATAGQAGLGDLTRTEPLNMKVMMR